MLEIMNEDQFFDLEEENELRVRNNEEVVSLILLTGLAEIYGTEMEIDRMYTFPPHSSIAVLTFHGARIKIIGRNVEAYVEKEISMILDVTLHAYLQVRREIAERENRKGPVTLVVGPTDVGKSTLCRLLLSYAARMGRRPFFVDLDVGQNSLSIPGTINIVNIEKPADIVDGFEHEPIKVYPFGYKSPGELYGLYLLQIKKLGQTIGNRIGQTNENARSSGIIINSCGWTRGPGYNAITFAALAFEITVLVVIDDERLYSQLKRDMPACVEVLYMPRIKGSVERNRPTRSFYRDRRVKEYFYGSSIPLHPFSFEVKYSEISIFKVCMSSSSNFEEATISDISENDIYLSDVPFGNFMLNKVLAVSSANEASNDVGLKHVLGFICVTFVNLNDKTLTVLSPSPEPLPSKILLLTNIELTDRAA